MIRSAVRFHRLHAFLFALGFLLPGTVTRAQAAPSLAFQSMKLVSNGSGWLLAGNRLFWTESVGAQWREITPARSEAPLVTSAFFSAQGKGWAVLSSSDGSVLELAHTTNKGQSWSYSPIASPFSEAAIFSGHSDTDFVDDLHGWVMLGLQSSSAFRRGLLLTTTDGGAHWHQAPMPPVGGNLLFTDALHGFTGPGPNGDELFSTSDAGETWHRVTLVAASPELRHAHSTISLPVFADASNGSLLRTYTGDAGTTVARYVTTDAGATWQLASTPLGNTFASLATDGSLIARSMTNLRASINAATPQSTDRIPIRSTFSTASQGIVLFAGGGCEAATRLCTQSQALKGTLDGGKTFFSLGPIPGIDLEGTTQSVAPDKGPIAAEARPKPLSSYPIIDVQGFDACSLPTVSQLQTWYTSSPYRTVGMYIGGDEFACSSGLSSLTPTYISAVLTQGWEIVPIWVGPQAPGAGFTYSINTNTATATMQGTTEADSAVAAMIAAGMGQGSTVIYDMEAYTYTNATYAAATTAFLDGWDTELHAKGYLAGVYSGHYEFDNWLPGMVTPAIDTIWFTYYFTAGVSCGSTCFTVYPTQSAFTPLAPYWLNHHRSRQTSSAINPVYGGLTLNVDEDYTDAAFEVAQNVALTVTKAGTGAGTAATATINNSLDTSLDTAITCGPTCTSATANFAATDTITLTATPSSGSAFVSWTGCTSVSGSTCTVATTAASTVVANFVSTVTYALTVMKAGAGSGTVTSKDGYIACGTTCSAAYTTGNSVVLSATPATGSLFSSWTGCTTTSGTTCNITTGNAAQIVTAVFTVAPTFSAALSAGTLSIVGGSSAMDTVVIGPQVGYTGTFTSFSCTGLPNSATCAFSPATLTALGDGAQLTSTLTITTIPVFKASVEHPSTLMLAGLLLPALLLPCAFLRRRLSYRGIVSLVAFGIMALGVTQLSGCTAGNPAPYDTVAPGLPFAGTINVTFSSATGTKSLPLQLSITGRSDTLRCNCGPVECCLRLRSRTATRTASGAARSAPHSRCPALHW